jgi:hypothetical protein
MKAKAASIVSKGRRKPALSAGLFGGCSLVQYPPELLLFSFGEGRSTGCLGLEQRSQEYPIILLGTDLTDVSAVRPAAHPLGLKDLRFALTTSLA